MARDPWKLAVFREAHALTLALYPLTAELPSAERFGLQGQLRRAAVSIGANVVEGCARRSSREYARFLEVALGSAAELQYLLRLADELRLLTGPKLAECRLRSEHVVRGLHNLQASVYGLTDRR